MKGLISNDNTCPYCSSEKTIHRGSVAGFAIINCKDCEKNFRSKIKAPGTAPLPLMRLRGLYVDINALLQVAAGIDCNAFCTVEITGKGMLLKKSDTGFFTYKKNKVGHDITFRCSELAQALREEIGQLDNKPVNFIYNENEKLFMGIIKKSDIQGIKRDAVNIELQHYLAVRPAGITSISALLRDTLQIKKGDTIMLYQKGKDYYIYVADPDIDDVNEGFRVSSQGAPGFVNYYAVSSSKLGGFLCDLFNITRGTPFRVQVSDMLTVDNRKMVKLIKAL